MECNSVNTCFSALDSVWWIAVILANLFLNTTEKVSRFSAGRVWDVQPESEKWFLLPSVWDRVTHGQSVQQLFNSYYTSTLQTIIKHRAPVSRMEYNSMLSEMCLLGRAWSRAMPHCTLLLCVSETGWWIQLSVCLSVYLSVCDSFVHAEQFSPPARPGHRIWSSIDSCLTDALRPCTDHLYLR